MDPPEVSLVVPYGINFRVCKFTMHHDGYWYTKEAYKVGPRLPGEPVLPNIEGPIEIE